jgi:hypothetical protein
MLHTLGYIHYFGDERSWFLGASATLSFSDVDHGLGIGPTLHFGSARTHSYIPHVSIGLLWHDFENGPDGPVLGVSIDLMRLFDHDGPMAEYKAALSGAH